MKEGAVVASVLFLCFCIYSGELGSAISSAFSIDASGR